jgi:hypothetical protein
MVPRDDDPTDVEFLGADDAAGADEDLPQPTKRELPGSFAQRRTLAIGAVVLAVLALAARAVRSHDHRPAASAPSTSSSPSASTTPRGLSATWEVDGPVPRLTDVVVVGPNGSGLVHVPISRVAPTVTDPNCPTADLAVTCTSIATVGPKFLAAVRHVFPGARATAARTVTTRGDGGGATVLFAQLIAKVGRTEILVQVQTGRVRGGPELSSDDGQQMMVYTSRRSPDGHTIQVQVTAPSGHGPTFETIDRLAASPGLLTPP